MSTNHKPEIPDGSEAIWDRMRLIPFNQRFDGKARKADKKLPEKLREELSGILLWAVQGCVEWYQKGLGSARAVEAATAAYRAETDVYERFFDDECVFGPEVRVSKTALFQAWERWCVNEGEELVKQVQFSRDMKEKGVVKNFEEKKVKGTWYWRGVSVRSDESPPPSDDKPSPPQKSWKQRGGERSGGKVSSDSENFSPEPSRVDSFAETGQNLPPRPKPSPFGFTTPLRWDEDGVEWEYVPVEESE